MGLFSVPMTVVGAAADRSVTIQALVDTGASHSMVPANILGQLGIIPTGQMRIRTADNRIVAVLLGESQIEVEGRRASATVLFQPVGSRPILGVSTLEALDFGVYTLYEQLIPGEVLHRLFGPPPQDAQP